MKKKVAKTNQKGLITFEEYRTDLEHHMELYIGIVIEEFNDRVKMVAEVVSAHGERLDEITETLHRHDENFDRVFRVLNRHDGKFDEIIGILQKHDKKLQQHDEKFEQVFERLDQHTDVLGHLMEDVTGIRLDLAKKVTINPFL